MPFVGLRVRIVQSFPLWRVDEIPVARVPTKYTNPLIARVLWVGLMALRRGGGVINNCCDAAQKPLKIQVFPLLHFRNVREKEGLNFRDLFAVVQTLPHDHTQSPG